MPAVASGTRRKSNINLSKHAPAKTAAEEQLSRLKSKAKKRALSSKPKSEPEPTPAPAVLERGRSEGDDSMKSKPVDHRRRRRRVRSEDSVRLETLTTAQEAFPDLRTRQQVLMTLPQPTIVSTRRNSPSRQPQVPSLLDSSAQAKLELLKLQTELAPQSPGNDESDSEGMSDRDVERAVSRQLAMRQLELGIPKRGLERRRPSFNRTSFALFATSFRRPSLGLDRPNQDSDLPRISNFHEEVSDSSVQGNDDDDDFLHLPVSLQLDPRNIMICCAAFVVVAVIGLGAWLSPVSGEDEIYDDGTTLGKVRARGFVKCGMRINQQSMNMGPNNSQPNLHAFNIEQCRAMALIALGNATKYEAVPMDLDSRFELLANETVDIITEGTVFTMGRDIIETNTKIGFAFTTPFFYAGLMIAGDPEYLDCVEASKSNNVDCRGLRICTVENSTHEEILLDVLNGVTIVANNNVESMIEKVQAGICNILAADPLFLQDTEKMFADREWKIGTKTLSKVPLSYVTRQNDEEWSMLANLAINAFIIASENSVQQQLALEIAVNISQAGSTEKSDFGPLLISLMSEMRDYGGFYESSIEALIPPGFGLNGVYDMYKTTGLLTSYPFGNVNELGPSPDDGSMLDIILTRGYLICGVVPDRGPGFASPLSPSTEEVGSNISGDWTGFDVEVCRAVAASIFHGDGEKVVFVATNSKDGPYLALNNGEVDVMSGVRVTLQAAYKERKTGQRFLFSSPYYYDNESQDAFALMTWGRDLQWSKYVFWIVMSIIYAEENGISADNSVQLPSVKLFGKRFESMLSDCISFGGNYGDMYERVLQNFIPRKGANRLNNGAGPQLYPIPII